MAGWSSLTNGSALDCVGGIVKKCQSNGCVNLDVSDVTKGSVEEFGDHKDRLRCLFDLVISGYLKRVTDKGFIRPMPPRLGHDGQSPDLFKLFLLVRKIGGYEFVSEKGLWSFAVKELGLDLEVSGPVKLVYAKYLHELEQWLNKSYGDGNREGLDIGNFRFLSLELEEEFRGLFIGLDAKNGSKVSDAKNRCRLHNGVEDMFGDYDKKVCRNDLTALDPAVHRKECGARKRKRESLSEMLNWVIRVAKCHNDPSVGTVLEPSKWKDHGGNEFWIQAIRARDALRQKRNDHSVTERSLLQNCQKMHPSMFEDDPMSKSCSCSFCISASTLENNLMCLHNTQSECGREEQSVVTTDSSSSYMSMTLDVDDSFRRPVFVGPRFQAEVPEWGGMVSDTDSKWLGTPVWPVEGGKSNPLTVSNPIGKGRADSCGCQIPGSVGCIRLHIAEKRMKLKVELGSVFYRWKFDEMGDEVSLRWMAEEEKKFKYMVQVEPVSLNAFWANAFKFFPSKTRQDLVSYYFNVFLIRCRSYQNRVTPKSIDSDDDELEFGRISDSLGSDILKLPAEIC